MVNYLRLFLTWLGLRIFLIGQAGNYFGLYSIGGYIITLARRVERMDDQKARELDEESKPILKEITEAYEAGDKERIAAAGAKLGAILEKFGVKQGEL